MKTTKKKNWKKIKVIFLILNLLLGLLFFFLSKNLEVTKLLDLKIYDEHIVYANQDRKASDDIIILLVDEASINVLQRVVGRWPWDRQSWGELVNFLSEDGEVENIFFDVLFTEYTTPPKDGVLDINDKSLIQATVDSGKIVHAAQLVVDQIDEKNKTLMNRELPEEAKRFIVPLEGQQGKFNNYYFPFKELLKVSGSIGVVEFLPDADGIARKTTLLKGYKDKFFPSLSVAALTRNVKPQLSEDMLKLGELEVPLVDSNFYVNLNPNIKTYSLSGLFTTIRQIEKGETENFFIDPEVFIGKDVFIGASAAAAYDMKYTAFGMKPGVLLQASILNGIKQKEYITFLGVWPAVFLLIVLILILDYIILYFKNHIGRICLVFGIFGSLIFGSLMLFDSYFIWMYTGHLINTLVLTCFLAFFYRTFYEGKDKRFLKQAFKNYISPELIDIIHASGELPELGGEIGERTAFFSDIAGFSVFSEKLTPEQLVMLINEYLTAMTNVLLRHKGTLDKFVGDAIVAFFGAPLSQEDHAKRSCDVALEMIEEVKQLRLKWEKDSNRWPKEVQCMAIRIGMNTGQILTGNMGAQGRLNYTMMGDEVNLAARLEGAGKYYGILIHASQKTIDALPKNYLYRKIDNVIVKGKTKPVQTYELIARDNKVPELEKLKEVFEQGLIYFYDAKFDLAQEKFKESLSLEKYRGIHYGIDTNPSEVYLKRIEELLQRPPTQDWNGIYALEAK